MTVSVVVKATSQGKPVIRKLDVSYSLVKYGPDASNQLNLKKLISLLQDYFSRENGSWYENISIKCSSGILEAEISFKNWPEGFKLAETDTAVLLLKEPAPAVEDLKRLKIPKDNLNFDAANAIHDPDAKGYCKHCFRKINKHNMNAHCEQRRRDMLDEAMPADKKKRIEQEAEQHSLSGFRR